MKLICEICKNKISTDNHHIRSKSKNGNNKKYNKCNLCPNCHRLVHEGGIIIEGRFFTSDCKVNDTELIWRYNSENSITELKEPEVYLFKKE